MGRREGRFPGAPGRPTREGRAAKERVACGASPPASPVPGMEVALGVERAIRAFDNIAGEGEQEEEMELHGFTDLDISLASERAASLRTEGDGLKHAIAEMRGLQLSMWAMAQPPHQPPGAKRKKGGMSVAEAKRRSIERRYSTETQSIDPKKKKKKKKKKRPTIVPQQIITVIEIPLNLQNPPEPKDEIRIPSWRPAAYSREWRNEDEDELEDTSDSIFEQRHLKAEEEEELLWEKWTAMREEEGKELGGRSQSSRWREVELLPPGQLATPRLRSERICSALSTASSTPGALSPSIIARVQEICVESIQLPGRSPSPPLPPKKKKRVIPKSLLPVLNSIMEEDQNIRRVPTRPSGSKENTAEGEETGRRARRQEGRLSSSSGRVLRDSNLTMARDQLARPMARPRSPARKEDYPLRSRSLARRTRRGVRR